MTSDPASIAKGLSELERELLTGSAKGWGSWMFSVGADLCAKGLGRRDGRGSIYLDTPLAEEVRSVIASGTSGSAQDPQGLDPKGAGPTSEGGDAHEQ